MCRKSRTAVSRQHCMHPKCTWKAGRPHTVTQTAGFIHRLDKLCRQAHQLQPVSYPFTGCLHWWPDYSEQDTVKGTWAACWRSLLRNVNTKTVETGPDTVIHSSHLGRQITTKSGGAANCKDKLAPKNINDDELSQLKSPTYIQEF